MYTNRFISLLVAISVLVVAFLVVREANATASPIANVDSATRSYTAWAKAAEAEASTVDSAMGKYYQNRAEAENLTRSRAADAARWEAMGRYYQQFGGGASLNLLRSRAADAARWTAMAEYYQKQAKAEAQNLASARAADAARWTAMAEYYQKQAKAEAQNLANTRAADAARWTAMGEYYAQFGATTP